MGIMQHHAIVATTWKPEDVARVKAWIAKRGYSAYFIVGLPLMNGNQTVVCVPDGSKEGWQDSDRGDFRRNDFKRHLATYAYSDGSYNSWSWVEVTWGENGPLILATTPDADLTDDPITREA